MILPLLLVMAEICPLLSDKEALRFASTCKAFWTAISPVTLLEIEKMDRRQEDYARNIRKTDKRNIQ